MMQLGRNPNMDKKKIDKRVSKKVTFEADFSDQDVDEFCEDMMQLGVTVVSKEQLSETNGTITQVRFAVFEATEQQMRNIMLQDGVAEVSDLPAVQTHGANSTNASQVLHM